MALSTRLGIMRKETLADRETQLNLLHQEILMKREALLHLSGNSLLQSARSLPSSRSMNPADASIRNARLLKDMENLNRNLEDHLNSIPSPRFVTLQSNYWSMVRSLLPLWEQSFTGKPSSSHNQNQQEQQRKQRQQQQPYKTPGKSFTNNARSTK